MQLKISKHLIITTIALVLPLVGFFWLKQSGWFASFYDWANANIVLFVAVVFLFKTIGYIYPPMPGGILTLGSIPFIGWFNAYLIDLAGSTVGSIVAYFLGKKYGFDFLQKIMDESVVEKIRKLKIKKHRELESIFMFRILAGGIAEVIAYAAGILKVGFTNFVIATTISHMVVGVPTYYLAQNIFSTSNAAISVVLAGFFIFLIFKLKGRYFE